jgi:hypothetical protein
VATLWRALLTQKQRADGSLYWCQVDDPKQDEALYTTIYKAHDGKLPNDHSYQYVVDALDAIIEYEGDTDTDTDTARDVLQADDYNHELLAWMASHSDRVSFCDEYLSEFVGYGNPDRCNVMDIIRGGQLKERTDVFEIVARHVKEAADELPQVWTRENTELHTWFERDRAHVELRAIESQETIVEWWDQDVQEAIEDGFLNPKDYHGSALEQVAAPCPICATTESDAENLRRNCRACNGTGRVGGTK